MKARTHIGVWISRTIAVVFAILETRGCIIHFLEEPWGGHAQFHSFTGLSYYIALVVFFFMITGKPLRDKEWWAWAAMVIMGVFTHGNMLIIDTFTGGLTGGGTSQGSGTMFYYLALAAFIMYMLAAGLTLPHFLDRDTDS